MNKYMRQAACDKFRHTAREKLCAYRHLLAIPALGVAAPFLFLRFGHISRGGALEVVWNMAGLCVLFLGQAIRVWAAGYIGRSGRSRRLKAATLITGGPYAHVRNPLYLGNFLLCLGVILFTESYALLLLSLGIFWTFYLPIIVVEEEFLQEQFGADYVAYQQAVPRLLPQLVARGQRQGTFQWSNLRKEYHGTTVVVSAILSIQAIEWQTHPFGFLAASGFLLIVPHLVEKSLKKCSRAPARSRIERHARRFRQLLMRRIDLHGSVGKSKNLSGAAWRRERATVLTLLAALLLLQVVYLFRYQVNTDELQHLHVVWGWAHGWLQYRDVFDNHAPLFHLLCTPLFLAFGEQPRILFQMRMVTLALYTLTLWSTYVLGCTLFSRRVGLWAAVLTGLFPGFFLCALEFRTDDLWTVLWLLTLTVLVGGRLTLGRSFLVGFLLGAALGTSVKTILLFAALSAAVLATMVLTARSGSRSSLGSLIRHVATALSGFLLVPVALALFFIFAGAWAPFFYGTVQHNVLPQLGLWRQYWAKVFLFPVTLPLLWWGARALLHNAPSVGIGARRVVIFLTTGGYLSALVSFWPLLTREDYLPFYPPFILLLTPALLSLPQWITRRVSNRWSTRLLSDIRAPVLVAIMEILLLLIRGSIWRNDARPVVEKLAEVLRLTQPGDLVMDVKGELVFRERAFYYALEPIARERMRRGLIADDIPERLIATRTCVAAMDNVRFPPRARIFLQENYLPVGRLRAAGQFLNPSIAGNGFVTFPFEVHIPARYAIVADPGTVTGWLDGTPYEGARFLAPGPHEFRSSAGAGRLALVWAQAVERGFSPFSVQGVSP